MGRRQFDLRTPLERAAAEKQRLADASVDLTQEGPEPVSGQDVSAWSAPGAGAAEPAGDASAAQPIETLAGTPDLTVGYAESYVDSSADVMEVAGEFIHRSERR